MNQPEQKQFFPTLYQLWCDRKCYSLERKLKIFYDRKPNGYIADEWLLIPTFILHIFFWVCLIAGCVCLYLLKFDIIRYLVFTFIASLYIWVFYYIILFIVCYKKNLHMSKKLAKELRELHKESNAR